MQAQVARLRFGLDRRQIDDSSSPDQESIQQPPDERSDSLPIGGFASSVMAFNLKASSVFEFISIPLAEFFGTLLYTFLSNMLGVANEVTLLSISLFEGLLIYMLSILIGPKSGAHMSPALTLSSFMVGQCRLILAISMMFMQCFGAFFGALFTRAVLSYTSFVDVLHSTRILRSEVKSGSTDDLLFLQSSSAEDFFLTVVLSTVFIMSYIIPMKTSSDGFATASQKLDAVTSFIGYRTLGQSTNIARTLANNVVVSIFAMDDRNWSVFYLFVLADVLASFVAVIFAKVLTINESSRNYNRSN
ncbi:hypothetical protein L596_002955 [Steinernema carpocapsae]|uniref:Aquaporin n=1 Tax=Steinernema carpocapsae TaxID=34508 RepID=A0A4V6I7V6_STECR|nr:hypothetical protein L596_002955 [Steinernema carpocapsae]